jgi:hypothetical protein
MTNLRFFFSSIGVLLIILAFTCDMSQHGQARSLGVGIGLTIFGCMLEDY